MIPFWGCDEAVSRWVASHIEGCERGFGKCRALGVSNGENIVAGVVYHNWHPEAEVIEMSAASKTKLWLTRPVLWEMFSYPFVGIGSQMVILNVAADNEMWNGRGLKRLLKAYGFHGHYIPRLKGRDKDGLLFTLTDTAWRANGFHRQNKV